MIIIALVMSEGLVGNYKKYRRGKIQKGWLEE